jgi:hypothetical protein
MVNFRKLTERAKDVVDKRGGTGSLKQDAEELRGIAKGKGSLKDKAKAAGQALKDPGARGQERVPHGGHEAAGERHEKQGRERAGGAGRRPEADGPATRSK